MLGRTPSLYDTADYLLKLAEQANNPFFRLMALSLLVTAGSIALSSCSGLVVPNSQPDDVINTPTIGANLTTTPILTPPQPTHSLSPALSPTLTASSTARATAAPESTDTPEPTVTPTSEPDYDAIAAQYPNRFIDAIRLSENNRVDIDTDQELIPYYGVTFRGIFPLYPLVLLDEKDIPNSQLQELVWGFKFNGDILKFRHTHTTCEISYPGTPEYPAGSGLLGEGINQPVINIGDQAGPHFDIVEEIALEELLYQGDQSCHDFLKDFEVNSPSLQKLIEQFFIYGKVPDEWKELIDKRGVLDLSNKILIHNH